jgi:hypothetical protein
MRARASNRSTENSPCELAEISYTSASLLPQRVDQLLTWSAPPLSHQNAKTIQPNRSGEYVRF